MKMLSALNFKVSVWPHFISMCLFLEILMYAVTPEIATLEGFLASGIKSLKDNVL